MHRPVGSGKTALLLALCRALRDEYNIGTFLFWLMQAVHKLPRLRGYLARGLSEIMLTPQLPSPTTSLPAKTKNFSSEMKPSRPSEFELLKLVDVLMLRSERIFLPICTLWKSCRRFSRPSCCLSRVGVIILLVGIGWQVGKEGKRLMTSELFARAGGLHHLRN